MAVHLESAESVPVDGAERLCDSVGPDLDPKTWVTGGYRAIDDIERVLHPRAGRNLPFKVT